MKTVSDDLYRLIKSLNKSEKGYFKKFAAKSASGSRQNYILLFDAIDELESYDENLLKKKLKDPSLVKQLAVYKVYLFNLILKSLHLYGAYENSESRLSEMLINVKTLVSKHLYKEADKVLKKAKELALKFDKTKFLYEILGTERHILMLMPGKNALEKRRKIFEEQQALLKYISDFHIQSWLCDQMTIFVDYEADYKTAENAAKIEEIMSNPYLADENIPQGYYSKMNFYHTHLIYSGSQNNNNKIFYYLKKEIDFYETNIPFVEENPINYASALINFMLFSSYEKRQKDVDTAIAKLNTLKKRLKNKIPRETEMQIFFHASNVEMIIFEKNCDIHKGRLKAKQIERDLAAYGNDVPVNIKALMLVNLACFYLIDDDHDSALESVNLVLNDPKLSLRNDVIEIARLLQLLIHYELGNYDLLEYLAESARKFFKAKKHSPKLENILVDFFRNAVKHPANEHKELFDELAFRLKASLKDLSGNTPQVYFDFVSWAESKADGKKLVELIRSKV